MLYSLHAEVLLSVESSILAVDNLESIDQRLIHGPFTHIGLLPNGKSLALLTLSSHTNAALNVVSGTHRPDPVTYSDLMLVLPRLVLSLLFYSP